MGVVVSCIRDCFPDSARAATDEHELGVPERSVAQFQALTAGQAHHAAPGNSLSQEDRAALRRWEQNGTGLDKALERGNANPEEVAKLDNALKKLPIFHGIMYRNIGFRPSTQGGGDAFTEQQAADRYIPGTTHASKSFSSGSPDPDAAMNNNRIFGVDVALAIKTSTASDLRPVATMPQNSEVIVARDKPLTVTAAEAVTGTSGQIASASSRGRPQERRFVVFANTPESSPVRPSEVDQEWLDWAHRPKDVVARAGMENSDDEGSMQFGETSKDAAGASTEEGADDGESM